MDDTTAVSLLAIGVHPVGAARNLHDGDEITRAHYAILHQAGVKLVPNGSIESVVAARPDLIVGLDYPDHDKLARQLRRIAPLLITDDERGWADRLLVLGRATGHESQAQVVNARLNRNLATLRAELRPRRGQTVSIVSSCGSGQFCAYGPGRSMGPLLRDLGFGRPAAQREAKEYSGYTLFSAETIGSQTGDIVVVLTGSVGPGSALRDSKLLDTRHSVVTEVDFGGWFGVGPLSVAWILRDLRSALLKDRSSTAGTDARDLWTMVIGA